MNKFLERIIEGVIVTDGSMQSVLSSMGFDETPIEIYNLKNPIIIEKIHFEFINAGAEIIQSNTLFGNTISLSQYKLDDRFYEINRKGVWLARTAVSYTHLRAHETVLDLVCRLLLEKKKITQSIKSDCTNSTTVNNQ